MSVRRHRQAMLDLGLPEVTAQSEAQVQRAILGILRRDPRVAWVDRRNSGAVVTRQGYRMQLCAEGTGDIEGMLRKEPKYAVPGRFFSIEVKAQGGRVSNAQRARIALIRKTGHYAGVARSVADALAIIEGRELDG